MSGWSLRWSGLLVSVCDPDEAGEAVAGGAAIVDVKDPARGPLGAAAPETAAAVAAAVAGQRPWTLACGELADDPAAVVRAAVTALPAGLARPAAAKAGPAGLDAAGVCRGLVAFADALPEGVEPVAVAYADWAPARAPAPEEVVAAAAAAGYRTLLVDTFDKSAAGIMDGDSAPRLSSWIARARAAGMTVAVAGRLGEPDVAGVLAAGAAVVAVRSAACRAGRWGRVDRTLVAGLAAAVAGDRSGAASKTWPSPRARAGHGPG